MSLKNTHETKQNKNNVTEQNKFLFSQETLHEQKGGVKCGTERLDESFYSK